MKVGDRVIIKYNKLNRYKHRLLFAKRSIGFLNQLPTDTIFVVKRIERESVDNQCSSCLHMHTISKEVCHYFNRGMGGSGKYDCPTYKRFKSKEVAILQIEDNRYKLISSYESDKFDVNDLELV